MGKTDTPALDAKLAELLWEPPDIEKGTKGQVGPRNFKYANLLTVMKALRPELKRLHLSWRTKPLLNDAGQFVVRWKITDLDSGECDTGDYPIEATAPQGRGSEITYASRYSVVNVTGLTPEGDDDDAAAASKKPADAPRPRTRAKTPGPDHTALREGTVKRATGDRPAQRGPVPPGEDHWDGQPPGDLPKPPAGKVGVIQQHFKRLGIADRGIRLGYTARLAGLDTLASTNDLTDEQQALVLKGIGMCKDQKKLDLLLSSGDAPQEATK